MKKFLKRAGIALLVILLVYIVSAFFCKASVHVERSAMINADGKIVFDNVNTLKNWKSWSYWDNIDPNMQSTYEGPESGVGAKHHWTSQHDSVGNGTLTITQSEPNKFVETRLEFEGMGQSLGGWKFADTAGAVNVTTYMDMDVPFFFRPLMAMMDMEKVLGTDFEKTLAGLKRVSEAAPAAPSVKIEASNIGPMKVLTVMDSCTSANISAKLGQLYGEIGKVMGKAGATMTGPVFAIYHKVVTNPDGSMNFWLEAGAQIDKEVKSEGRVQYKEMPGGNVVRADHYGPYNSTGNTHNAVQAWMLKNGKKAIGDPWETYVTDPMVETDTAKWLTQIYYPVQ